MNAHAESPAAKRCPICGKAAEQKETAEVLNLIGVATARLGETDAAFELFDKSLSQEPGYGAARLNKAHLLAKFGHGAAAKEEVKRLRDRQGLNESDPGILPGAMRALGGAP